QVKSDKPQSVEFSFRETRYCHDRPVLPYHSGPAAPVASQPAYSSLPASLSSLWRFRPKRPEICRFSASSSDCHGKPGPMSPESLSPCNVRINISGRVTATPGIHLASLE